MQKANFRFAILDLSIKLAIGNRKLRKMGGALDFQFFRGINKLHRECQCREGGLCQR
jgi:hypothetical protein